jgi:hypothetical protein
LYDAILSGANLNDANLRNVSAHDVRLQGADLTGVNLYRALLHSANLQGANLTGANVQGTIFGLANMREVDLTEVLFNETISIPDGACLWAEGWVKEWPEAQIECDSYWTPNTDMARFTDPNHPGFWDPCMELDEPPWWCEIRGE